MDRNKLAGMFTGIAIGSSGRMHWQLTKAVSESLIQHGPDIAAIADAHVAASTQGLAGWDNTTKEAVERLAREIDVSKSGDPDAVGNEALPKLAPLAAYLARPMPPQDQDTAWTTLIQTIYLTHANRYAGGCGLVFIAGIMHCLGNNPSTFDADDFASIVEPYFTFVGCLAEPDSFDLHHLKHQLRHVFEYATHDHDHLVRLLGKHPDMLPLTLILFLQDPFSADSLSRLIRGDIGTQGAVLGALLGSLNGPGIFPHELVEALPQQVLRDIQDLSQRFSATMSATGDEP